MLKGNILNIKTFVEIKAAEKKYTVVSDVSNFKSANDSKSEILIKTDELLFYLLSKYNILFLNFDKKEKKIITKEIVFNFFYQMRFKNLLMELNKETVNINSFDDETISLVSEITEKFNCILQNAKKYKESKKDEVKRLTNLDLMPQSFSIELKNYLRNKQKEGKFPFPIYSRKEHLNPLNYLKEFYGDLLDVYNRGEGNFMFQQDLAILDKSFRGTLATYVSRKGFDMSDYVPSISDKIDMQIKEAGFCDRADFLSKIEFKSSFNKRHKKIIENSKNNVVV